MKRKRIVRKGQRVSAPGVADKALLVALTVRFWAARKKDKAVSREVAEEKGAVEDAGVYVKRLLGGRPEAWRRVQKAANEVRNFHYENTLPWEEGLRILPAKNFLDYQNRLRDLRAEYDRAVEEFVAQYGRLKENARRELGDLYDEKDYPSAEAVRRKFAVEVSYYPMPQEQMVRLQGVAAEDLQDVRRRVEAQVEEGVRAAVRDLYRRLHEVVAHAHERLSDPDKVFRDSLIGNIRRACDAVSRLNLTDDPELNSLRDAVMEELGRHDPDTLRRNPDRRALAAKKADALAAKLAAYVQTDE